MDVQDIPSTSHVLATLIQTTLDPMVSQPVRLDALQKIEDFKNHSPLCAQCGLFLIRCSDYSHIVRHTGIQLMEHCIKYRWYVMSQEEKVFIKEACVALLAADNSDIIPLLRAHRHTLDAISRIFVEMIKREWPQHWPDMFSEFSAICALGTVQTELILYVFLRLSEDVVSLQTLESVSRRRDLCQELNSSMKKILCFFRSTLESHVGGGGEHDAIVSITLTTLSEYLEWIPPSNLFENETLMIQLFGLIQSEQFQTQVAECMEKVASRRGKQEEKLKLHTLMSRPELWSSIHATVSRYQSQGAATKSVIDFYKPLSGFLKNYLQLLTSLFSSTDAASLSTLPPHFTSLVDILVNLLHTKSLAVLDNLYTGWSSLLRHKELSHVPALVVAMEKYILVSCSANLIRKKGGLSQENCSGVYSEDDFMDETDYRRHFVKIKTLILQNFRELSKSVPDLLFLYAEQWMIRSISNSTTDAAEWEALCGYVDSFIDKLILPKYLHTALSLISLLLAFTTEDAMVFSSALSCLSSLFSYLTICSPDQRNEYLPKVLDKIFTLLLFSPSGPDSVQPSRLKSVKMLRKHAGSLIVRLAARYPSLLSPFFDTILQLLLSCSPQLSQLQVNCLQESLLSLQNHSGSFGDQAEFVRSLLERQGCSASVWAGLTRDVFCSPAPFIAWVGLNLPRDQEDAVSTSNRIQITRCTNLIAAILRRCRPPKSRELLKQGGYLNGDKVVNPMTSHVLPLIPGVLKLVNIIEQLHNPEFHAKGRPAGQDPKSALIHEDMLPALDTDEAEKKNLLGEQYFGNPPSSCEDNSDLLMDKSPVHHVQSFINSLFENLFMILGFLARTMTAEVYSIPEISRALHEHLFADIARLPNFRVRLLIRHFVRPYVSSCPSGAAQDNVLLPFMSYFTVHMYQRINAKWESLAERQLEAANEAAQREEAVDEVVVLMMQREYMEVIRDLLLGHGGSNGSGGDDEMISEAPPNPPPNRLENLSELGVKIARNKLTSEAILIFLIRCLSYHDTQSSLRTGRFLLPLVVQLISDSLLNEEIARLLFSNLLQGFHVHGEHDANQGALLILSVQLYTLLRPQYPCVRDTLLLIPNLNEQDLAKFDEKILAHCSLKNSGNGMTNGSETKASGGGGVIPAALLSDLANNRSERAHKDMFRKLVSNIIGKNVGQLFKCRATVKELPRLAPRTRPSLPGGQRDAPLDDIARLFN